jgi:hypothetical protein
VSAAATAGKIVLDARELREAAAVFDAGARELQESRLTLRRALAHLPELPPSLAGRGPAVLAHSTQALDLLAGALDHEARDMKLRAGLIELDLARPWSSSCPRQPPRLPASAVRVRVALLDPRQRQQVILLPGGRFGILFKGAAGKQGKDRKGLSAADLAKLAAAGGVLGAPLLKGGTAINRAARGAQAARRAEQAAVAAGKGAAKKATAAARPGVARHARFGHATTSNYRETFFRAHPELRGRVVVHHAVEQRALRLYPKVVSKAEIHSLQNLRGVPKSSNADVHLRAIRKAWNRFYKEHPSPSKRDLLDFATHIDKTYGKYFRPRLR